MKKFILVLIIFFTSSIYSQFVPEWASTYNSGYDVIYNFKNFATDQNQNYYLSGRYYHGFGQADNIITMKFNSLGTIQWSKIFNNAGADSYDYVNAVYMDNQGYICVLGNSVSLDFNLNIISSKIFVLKYDNSGNLITSGNYQYPGVYFPIPISVIFDYNTDFYLAGSIREGGYSAESLFVAKINTNAQVQWIKTYAAADSSVNRLYSIKNDQNNNVYVTGEVSIPNYDRDIITMKYNSNGILQWAQTYRFNNSQIYDAGYDISLDNNQNVYVSGIAGITSGNDTGMTGVLKYNNNGQLQWANTYNLSNSGSERGEKILIENNNIYIKVNCYGQNDKLLKINSNGQQQWVYQYTSKPYYVDFDNSYNIIDASSKPGYNRTELALERVNSSGSLDWNYRYSYNGSGSDIPYTFKSYNDYKIFVAGKHNGDLLLLKLTPSLSNSVTLSRNNLNKPILDSQIVYDTVNFNIPAGSYVKDVNVTIDSLLHTATGDLEIYLLHGDKTDTLVYRRGGFFDNFIGTHLDDTASLNICSNGIPPYTGYFKPCDALSQFNFLPANGPWILKIYDRRSPDTGVLKRWSISLSYESPIGINQISSEVPNTYGLHQNYPNPFNPLTKIKFSVAKTSDVEIIVYDILGREIDKLVNQSLTPGIYETDFDGSKLSSGIYFYKLITQEFTETKKMVLVK